MPLIVGYGDSLVKQTIELTLVTLILSEVVDMIQ